MLREDGNVLGPARSSRRACGIRSQRGYASGVAFAVVASSFSENGFHVGNDYE
jgi:hypothetical protein